MTEENSMPPILGTVRDEPDSRDYQWEKVMGAIPIGMPTFSQGYDVEERYGSLPDHPQNSAYDCVGEGTSQDVNMSIKIKTKRNIILSARDIYSQIYAPGGGSSPRNAYKLLKNIGACEDKYLPTRPNGQVLTESFARKRNDLLPNPVYWKIGPYYSINSKNIQALSQAIFQNDGCGGAYFPKSGEMGHFIFFRGYGMFQGRKALKYRDSYDPFTKWLTRDQYGNYYLQDGTPVELAGLWTFEPLETWPVYEKKEVTCEQARYIYSLRKDVADEFPAKNKFYQTDKNGVVNPNYTIYDWCRDYGFSENPEVFVDNILDWSKVDKERQTQAEQLNPQTAKQTKSFLEIIKTLWQNLLKFLSSK